LPYFLLHFTHSYKKGELEGKNIKILMPQPFSGRHDQYLRNYLSTGGVVLSTCRPDPAFQCWSCELGDDGDTWMLFLARLYLCAIQ
jgi:hypothetical protein